MACKRKHGAGYKGRTLTVHVCEQKGQQTSDMKLAKETCKPPSNRLCIHGLSYDTKEDDLQKVFGRASSVYIARDGKTKESRGCVHIG